MAAHAIADTEARTQEFVNLAFNHSNISGYVVAYQQAGVDDTRETYYNFSFTKPNTFGHWTNNKVAYRRYYDRTGGEINTPVDDIVVLTNYFALYGAVHDSGHQIPTSHPNINLGAYQITGDEHIDSIVAAPAGDPRIGRLQTGVGLDILLAGVFSVSNPAFSANKLIAVRDNLQKYICAQFYYCFINQYYDTDNSKGIRLYFDSYSMNIFKVSNVDMAFVLNWEYILQHIDKTDNIEIHRMWYGLDHLYNQIFANEIAGHHIRFDRVARLNDVNAINYEISGLPSGDSLYCADYTITISGGCTPEQRHILLIKMYMFFACCNPARWVIRNRLFQYFEYYLDSSLLTNYQITVNGRQKNFYYAKTQGCIGQYLRYLALGQSSVPGGLPRPKVIYIRDAHHSITTRRELVVMNAFKAMPGKRYFWAIGETNAQPWHQPPVDAFDMENHTIGQSSGTPANTLRSCWAGLQTFKQLRDEDVCVFASNRIDFIRTLGLLLLLDVGNPAHVVMCRYVFGIYRSGQRGINGEVPLYYSYGIDERMLTNCFYSVVEIDNPNNIVLRMSTDEEKRNSLRWQEAISVPPEGGGDETLATANKNAGVFAIGENWRKRLMNNSIFYTFSLDLSDTLGLYYKFNLGPDSTRYTRDVVMANNTTSVDEALGAYIRYSGSFPKSTGDFLRFVERRKDNNMKTLLSLSRYSLYHECKLFFSSYNAIVAIGITPWFNKTFTRNLPAKSHAEIRRLNSLAVPPKDNNFHVSLNFLYNITNHNKRSVLPNVLPAPAQMGDWSNARSANNLVMCYGDIRDSSNLNTPYNSRPTNACLTQPIDLMPDIVRRVATTGISNIRRGGLSFDPATEITNIDVADRLNPYQMGGNKNTPNTPKKLNNAINNLSKHKMISTKEDHDTFIWALRNKVITSFDKIDAKSRVSINNILKDATISTDIFNIIIKKWIEKHPELMEDSEYTTACEIIPNADVIELINKFSDQFATYSEFINKHDEKPFFDMFFKGISTPVPSMEAIERTLFSNFLLKNKENASSIRVSNNTIPINMSDNISASRKRSNTTIPINMSDNKKTSNVSDSRKRSDKRTRKNLTRRRNMIKNNINQDV